VWKTPVVGRWYVHIVLLLCGTTHCAEAVDGRECRSWTAAWDRIRAHFNKLACEKSQVPSIFIALETVLTEKETGPSFRSSVFLALAQNALNQKSNSETENYPE
jgi:hypothetical protein